MIDQALLSLPIPLVNAADLKHACSIVDRLRKTPWRLWAWRPEGSIPAEERLRRELALSLQLVLSLQVGRGDAESRLKACQQLYRRNLAANTEAIHSGELLLRSRMTSGATDTETFWLAAAFARPLEELAPPELSSLAWQYLIHAPFAVDFLTALRFVRHSRKLTLPAHPHWPLELCRALLDSPTQADVGAILLEAYLSQQLGVVTMEGCGQRLLPKLQRLSQSQKEAVVLLADHYVRGQSEFPYARDVIRAAACIAEDASHYVLYLGNTIFDLSHRELYQWMAGKLDAPTEVDEFYEHLVEQQHLTVGRRLTEVELVRRLSPWRTGAIQPQIHRALRRIVGGADADNRIRVLAVRLALLHSRSAYYTEEAANLVRRVTLDQTVDSHAPLSAEIREELERYIQEADPHFLLQQELKLLLDRWDQLSGTEQTLMRDVRDWMMSRLEAGAAKQPSWMTAQAGVDGATIEASHSSSHLTGNWLLWELYRRIYAPFFWNHIRHRIEHQLGQPYERILELDVSDLTAMAREMALLESTLVGGIGALAGSLGGFRGAALDSVGVLLLSIQSVAQIGACFGIEPGTREGFEFLCEAILLSVSTDDAGVLAAYLLDQRPRFYRALSLAMIFRARSQRHVSASDKPSGGGVNPGTILRALSVGATDTLFLRQLQEAATQLAARRWVLARHGLNQRPVIPNNFGVDSALDEETEGLE